MQRAKVGVAVLTKSETLPLRLEAYALACERGGRMVFRDISFSLGSGEALVVIGPNGVGKSSLLRLLAGLVDIAAGKIALEGGLDDLRLAEQAHYIGHLDALKPAMTVQETAQFWSDFLGGSKADLAEAFDVFDLEPLRELPVAYLSAGQRRRLALARLLIAPRAIWLLDEPSVALDSASLARLVAAMEAHLSRGGLIVTATHQALGLSRHATLDLGAEAISSRRVSV